MSLDYFIGLSEQLGSLSAPMFICAFLCTLLILERLAMVLQQVCKREAWFHRLTRQPCRQNPAKLTALIEQVKQGKGMLSQGAHLLLTHAEQSRSLRDEIVSLWLANQKRRLLSGLKMLQVIGIITPLLGLLGTVLGLIDMFTQLGLSAGPVTPAQLASGLGLAMNTTAAGLIIAVPAITLSHLFGIWAERRCSNIAHSLNQINLWIEGVDNALTINERCGRARPASSIGGNTPIGAQS